MYKPELSYSYASEDAWDRARKIKAMVLDSDGVIFRNEVEEGFDAFIGSLRFHLKDYKNIPTPKPKWRSYYDGQGISLMRSIGLRVLIVTNEKDSDAAAVTSMVEKMNSLPSCKKGAWPQIILKTDSGGMSKLDAAVEFASSLQIDLEQCGFICDDLVDNHLAGRVGFVASPITAEEIIKKKAHVISRRHGGEGALRDVANFILESRGIDPTTIAFK
jgi:3-deoxy-D-manno-octulosonate 8-phosphate phosphatase KdsC-like HAD superfamily phosphatase